MFTWLKRLFKRQALSPNAPFVVGLFDRPYPSRPKPPPPPPQPGARSALRRSPSSVEPRRADTSDLVLGVGVGLALSSSFTDDSKLADDPAPFSGGGGESGGGGASGGWDSGSGDSGESCGSDS